MSGERPAPATVAGIPLVVARGTPEEIGRSYAEQARDRVLANLDLYRSWFADAGLDDDAVRAAGAAFRAETTRRFPRIAATLDGLAAGVGRRAEEVFAVNARTELLAKELPGFEDGGCTAVGVQPGVTGNGHTLLAQNWDWSPRHREAMVVLATEDERGHAVVALAEAGMLAKAGLNRAGIGTCVNLLGSGGDGGTTGVPYHVILRAVLESTTFGEAVLAAAGPPRSASVNVLVGSSSGEVVDLELVPGDVGWLWPTAGVVAHANHFESAVAAVDKIAARSRPSSEYRSGQARRLVGEAATRAAVTADDLLAALRHHGELSICLHAEHAAPDEDPAETLASVILDLDAARMAVVAGPPCTGEPEAADLRALFG